MSLDEYKLRRDHAATARLNLQHMLFVDTFGSILHPVIEAASQKESDFEIIDVGTGRRIVPLQLSKHLAKQPKSLVGLDISDRQFPHAEWLPKNVRLVLGDAFDTSQPNAEFRDSFDAVYVRYFFSLIQEDPEQFINFLVKLLKPGGYLQWVEPLMSTMQAGSDGRHAPGMATVATFLRDKVPGLWLDDLPDTLKKRGLEIVDAQRHEVEPWQRGFHVHNFTTVASEFTAPLSPSIIDQANRELQAGSRVDFKFISVLARLPKS